MKRLRDHLSVCFILLTWGLTFGQDTDRKIEFPDLANFKTLKTDLHIHTVFSDGSVWPNIRVQEAVADGLDAISLTEHLEYQPHLADIPHPDRNRSYEIAKQAALPHDLIIIHGAEITRRMPPGHANAIFITDANKLNVRDSLVAYQEAQKQGAFVFWNHPHWIAQQPDGVATMSEFHKMLVEKNLLHGIEVVNEMTYSEEGMEIANEYGITPLGTSDIHGLVDYQFRILEGGHRPITLVFSTERNESGIKEALFAGRTVSWYNNILVGKKEWVEALVASCLSFEYGDYIGPSSMLQVKISNNSDAGFLLKNNSPYSMENWGDVIEILPHSKQTVLLRTLENLESVSLDFEILNAMYGKKKFAELKVKVSK